MRRLWLLGATALTTLALEGPALAATDEIIVSARKREESLQDVPVSATVLASEDLENLVLGGFEDYLRQIPGAINVGSGPDYLNDISVRGQGGGRLGFSESATGIYRNGIYTAGGGFGGRSFSRMDTFDLKRVETYRGPQGALYGRNAVGGAINVISQRPKNEYESKLKFGVGEYNAYWGEAIANVPVIDDKLAVRLGGFYSEQDGFHKRLEDGVDVDPRQYYGGRLGTLVKPWEDATVVLTLEHYKSQAPAFGTTGRNVTRDPSYFVHGLLDRTPPADILENAFMLEYEHDLGFANLTAVAAYKFRRGARINEDLDHFSSTAPTADATATQSEHFERWGAEVRLASSTTERWHWLVGADWQMTDESVDSRNTAIVMAVRTVNMQDVFEEALHSYSVFGSADYDITDALNFGLELRVLYDEKEFFGRNYLTMVTGSEKGHWLRPTPAATLTYKINADHTAYGRFATGYRPGGYNQNNAIQGGTDQLTYDPEYTFSYEVGWKGSFFDRQVQVSGDVFYAYTNDVQSPIAANMTVGVNAISLVNSGDTDLYGAEVEVRGRTDFLWGNLLAVLGLSTVTGEYSDGAHAPVTVSGMLIDANIGGGRVQRTRDYIVNLSLTYTQPIFNSDWKTAFTTSFQTENGGYENIAGNVASLASVSRELQGYEVFDFRWAVFNDHWRASVFAKNAFNDIYRTQQLTGNDYSNNPRTVGAEVAVTW